MRMILRWIFLGSIYGVLTWVTVQAQAVTHDLGQPLWWDANTETDVDEYGVFRNDSPCLNSAGCPPVEVATVPQGPDPISWTEPEAIPFRTVKCYRVTARNTSGLESPFSTELCVDWLNPLAPAAPGDPRTAQTTALFFIWDSEVTIFAKTRNEMEPRMGKGADPAPPKKDGKAETETSLGEPADPEAPGQEIADRIAAADVRSERLQGIKDSLRTSR